jgi:glycosidase
MIFHSTKKITKVVVFCLLFSFLSNPSFAQQRVKKVVVQAFWWDNWNNNFRFKWADYLTELAPRLKALGVDAIWVPPNYKNDGPGSVGYGPFDQYDLGDKYQKGETLSDTVRTRSGNKDELLRMIAVMHANGIEVIQDIVLNHTTGAGNRGGGGGRDYTAASIPYQDNASNYFKNFRYSCYATPFLDTSTADYWTRTGRWSKNLHNFYPNIGVGSSYVNTNNINSPFFGPDMAYESVSKGQSTNIPTSGTVTIKGITKPYYNPTQPNNYMAKNAKDWIMWYKKQTGADGFRWDAVKHFGFDLQRDLTYALKYQSGFANGGNTMFNVGEWVGQASEIDYYADSLVKAGTPTESGVANEPLSGGFDFGLRGYSSSGGIYSMVTSGGSFNMQNIPGAQQQRRYFDFPNGTRVYKTVPFVNSHDTYRPVLTANGNYSQALGNSSGWGPNELGGNGQHIDPREPRFAAANAVIAAVDGNPCFFIEDVFDYFSVNKRWVHLPTDVDSLPLRKDVGNIMQCHQSLKFKDGNYAVPTALTGSGIAPVYAVGNSGDHLVIERTGKAIIGISDAYSAVSNNTADQQVWVTADNVWATGTLLYDYSGTHGVVGTQIYNDHRVLISTAPCGHTIAGSFGHGYSIWAPYPNGTPTSVADLYNYINTAYTQPAAKTTTQEWEMADDLGDSHCASLGQGGQLPANSTNQRVAGKIFVQSGTTVTYKLFPEIDNTNINISLWDLDGNKLSEISGNSTAILPITANYSTTYTGWITIKVRNTDATQPAQKVWANVTYTAPTTLNTRDSLNRATTRVSIWTGNKATSDITDCGNWEEGKIPTANSVIIIPTYSLPAPVFPNALAGRTVSLTNAVGTYKLVKNVQVNVLSATGNNATSSDVYGVYSSSNLVPKSYTIKPTKNNDVTKANGVKSVDVILVQRHILNQNKLNSAYKIIAADVNGDKNINSVDVIRMKRLILGSDTTFSKGSGVNKVDRLWEFVDSAYVFADTTNPFPFKDSIVAKADISGSKNNQTFIGIKLGDVNYDWDATVARLANTPPLELVYATNNEELAIKNSNIRIPITANNFNNIAALQYTLHFDNKKYKLVAVENNALEVEYNAAKQTQTGNVSFVWTDKNAEAKSVDSKQILFTLVLQSLSNKSNLNLDLNNDITEVAAWDNDLKAKAINLTKQITTTNTKQLFSIYPNPSNGIVNIDCKDAKQIVIIDALGKTINQPININAKTINIKLQKGVYIVQATMQNGTIQKEKLIVE